MLNFVRYRTDTKMFNFAHLNDDQIMDLNKNDTLTYYRQHYLWTNSDHNPDELEALMDGAKLRATAYVDASKLISVQVEDDEIEKILDSWDLDNSEWKLLVSEMVSQIHGITICFTQLMESSRKNTPG